VVTGVVVGPDGAGASVVEFPRRHASDDTTNNRPEARDILLALAVTKAGTASLAVVAVSVSAAARRSRARAGADSAGTTTAITAGRVAVEVIAWAWAVECLAESRSVDLPPPAVESSRRASVAAVDSATELGVAVATLGAAIARRTAAVADRGVGRARAKDEIGGSDR
jgi:hypothetical protein